MRSGSVVCGLVRGLSGPCLGLSLVISLTLSGCAGVAARRRHPPAGGRSGVRGRQVSRGYRTSTVAS
jgi:hypothetical protein